MSGVAKAGDYWVAKERTRSRVLARARRAKYALKGLDWILVGSEPLADYINTAKERHPDFAMSAPTQQSRFPLQISLFLLNY